MSGRRSWTFVALAVSGLWLGCRDQVGRSPNPSASEREGRSDVLRGLMSSKEKAPDPEALKEATAPLKQPQPAEAQSGQGGSGRPDATKRVEGQVSWVGDNELLVRDARGTEHDFEVNPDTRLLSHGNVVPLGAMEQGANVRVSYDEGPGGLVARQVEELPTPPESSSPSGQGTTPREGEAPRGGETAPLR